MQFVSAYNLIDSVVVFLLLLLSLFLLRLRSGDRRDHRLLAGFLVSLALSYMDGVFIGFGYYFHYSYPHMVYATMSFDFLAGPLLYLYVRARTQPDFRLSAHHLWLALPFALHFGFIFANYHVMSEAGKRALLAGGQVFSRNEVYVLTVTSNLQYAGYIVLVLYMLRGYHRAIKDAYSELEKFNLQWLYLICGGLLLGGLMRLLNNLLWLEVPQSVFHQYVDLKLVAIGSVLAFGATAAYKCLQQPEVLRFIAKHSVPQKLSPPPPSAPIKYKTSALAPGLRMQLASRVEAHMRAAKPYFQPTLSLAELAQAVGIPAHHLSQVINGELSQNFYDYINGYRVRECAQRLRAPDCGSGNITQIMYECGFNSKSVFNSAFKKVFDTTPSAYRRQHLGRQTVTDISTLDASSQNSG